MRAPKWIVNLPKLAQPPPLKTLLRSARDRFLPPKPVSFTPAVTTRQARLLRSGAATAAQVCPISVEDRPGQIPTIVVGGFVPGPQDATYLQRGLFLKLGSIHYVHYPQDGFSTALFEAQLSDLVEELSLHHRTPPVVFAVSFGGGLVIHWLRHLALDGERPQLAGLVLVSPVGCTADLLEPGIAKPSTLLGRLMKGFLETPLDSDPAKFEAWVEKSRQVMVKMFEAGAQNKEALRQILTREEGLRIRDNVFDSMRGTTPKGAKERTRALHDMPALDAVRGTSAVLTLCPAVVLYAEKESSIMVDAAPTRRAFEENLRRHLPQGSFAVVTNPKGSPVQHASLLFHCFNFNPHLEHFYKSLRHRLPGTRRLQHTLTRFVRPAHAAQRRKAVAAARAAALSSDSGSRLLLSGTTAGLT